MESQHTLESGSAVIDQTHTFWLSIDALLTWCFGIIMLVAAVPHWENPYYFLGSIYAYKLVDPGIGQVVAMVLPLTQLIVAICMIVRIFVDVSHLIVMILFSIFLVVQCSAYFGSLDISCGCFGPQLSMSVGIYSLSFIGLLCVLSVARNIIAFYHVAVTLSPYEEKCSA